MLTIRPRDGSTPARARRCLSAAYGPVRFEKTPPSACGSGRLRGLSFVAVNMVPCGCGTSAGPDRAACSRTAPLRHSTPGIGSTLMRRARAAAKGGHRASLLVAIRLTTAACALGREPRGPPPTRPVCSAANSPPARSSAARCGCPSRRYGRRWPPSAGTRRHSVLNLPRRTFGGRRCSQISWTPCAPPHGACFVHPVRRVRRPILE